MISGRCVSPCLSKYFLEYKINLLDTRSGRPLRISVACDITRRAMCMHTDILGITQSSMDHLVLRCWRECPDKKVFLSFLFFQISSTYGELIYDTKYQQHPHNQLLKVGVPHQLRTLRPPSAPCDRLSSPRSHRRSSTPPSTPCRTLRS